MQREESAGGHTQPDLLLGTHGRRPLPSLILSILVIANYSDSKSGLALQESGTQKFLLGGVLRPTVRDGVAPSPHHGEEL